MVFDKQARCIIFLPSLSFILKMHLVVSRGDVISTCIKLKSQVRWEGPGEKYNRIILFSFKRFLGPLFLTVYPCSQHPASLGLIRNTECQGHPDCLIRAFSRGLQVPDSQCMLSKDGPWETMLFIPGCPLCFQMHSTRLWSGNSVEQSKLH